MESSREGHHYIRSVGIAPPPRSPPDGGFATGDVGRWTDVGFLQIIDRKKDILVTSGGKNIPPANLEARFAGELARHETIKRHVIAEAPLGVADGTLTSSFKLRRKAVYERLRDQFEALYEPVRSPDASG
jgi:long-chain acyl-CoA synthetase